MSIMYLATDKMQIFPHTCLSAAQACNLSGVKLRQDKEKEPLFTMGGHGSIFLKTGRRRKIDDELVGILSLTDNERTD